MSTNVDMLVLSIALLLLLNLIQAMQLTQLHGLSYTSSPRDRAVDAGVFGGRVQRTKANLVENLLMFAPLSVLGELMQVNHGLVATGAVIFFIARVVHTICYLAGIPYLRTLAWLAGVIGTVMVAFAVLGWA